MNFLTQSIFLFFLFVLNSFAPGFFFVRRFRRDPLETTVLSIGLSYLILYFLSFLIYIFHLPSFFHFYISFIAAILFLFSLPDLIQVARNPHWRKLLFWFGVVLAWSFLQVALIRQFSRGGWFADWAEHFQRVQFFLDHLDLNFTFVEEYLLPARPPFMNLLGTHFLSQTQSDFPSFQIIFLLLNSTVFFSYCLVATYWGRNIKTPLLILAALFLMNPMVIGNLTYSWTKHLASFYILSAIYFYLRWINSGQRVDTVFAFLSLSCGTLCHYSAVVYAMPILGTYLYGLFRFKQPRIRDALLTGLICALLLVSWLGWSWFIYGPKVTFASNTAVVGSSKLSVIGNAKKVFLNTRNTIVPHTFHDVVKRHIKRTDRLAYLRDYFFFYFQTNAIFALGLIGGPLFLATVLFLEKKYPVFSQPRKQTVLLFLLAWLLLGIAVHGAPDTFGVAHVTLQPIVLFSLTIFAAHICIIPRRLKALVVMDLMLNVLLGILPVAWFESRVPRLVRIAEDQWGWNPQDSILLTSNFSYKFKSGYQFLGDYVSQVQFAIWILWFCLFLFLFSLIAWKLLFSEIRGEQKRSAG